jgi:hypothetical protein
MFEVDTVVRVMTSKHIPLDPERKRKGKTENGKHQRTNFLPFKHFLAVEDGFVEVLRSHWEGDFVHGSFNPNKGRITDELAKSYMLLVSRIATKPNFSNYSFIDEMKSYALSVLVSEGLRFDETRGDNPFGYWTTLVVNAFIRVITQEEKQQMIRDDICEHHGLAPSHSRQNRMAYTNELKRNNVI